MISSTISVFVVSLKLSIIYVGVTACSFLFAFSSFISASVSSSTSLLPIFVLGSGLLLVFTSRKLPMSSGSHYLCLFSTSSLLCVYSFSFSVLIAGVACLRIVNFVGVRVGRLELVRLGGLQKGGELSGRAAATVQIMSRSACGRLASRVNLGHLFAQHS